jgi:hypothetical protein
VGKKDEANMMGTPAKNYMKLQHKEFKIFVAKATLWPFMEAARRKL